MLWDLFIASWDHDGLLHLPIHFHSTGKFTGWNDIGEDGGKQNDPGKENKHVGEIKSFQFWQGLDDWYI